MWQFGTKWDEDPRLKPIVAGAIEALYLCIPLLILAILILPDAGVESLLKKPEWSFVSLYLWMDGMSDSDKFTQLSGVGMDEQYAWKAKMFMFSFLLLILVLDYRHSTGIIPYVGSNLVYICKFSIFLYAFFYRFYSRARLTEYAISLASKKIPAQLHPIEL